MLTIYLQDKLSPSPAAPRSKWSAPIACSTSRWEGGWIEVLLISKRVSSRDVCFFSAVEVPELKRGLDYL